MLSLDVDLKIKFFDLGLGLELCGLVNNAARPLGS